MQAQEILRTLRERQGLTQEQLADKILVTRQAVSRWENGETVPGTETLKLLSREFDVSINTLLGSPCKLVCHCCGMPLEEDATMSREADGTINENYCQWCYKDGTYVYGTMEELIDYLAKTFSSAEWPEDTARAYYAETLSKLPHWQKAE